MPDLPDVQHCNLAYYGKHECVLFFDVNINAENNITLTFEAGQVLLWNYAHNLSHKLCKVYFSRD